MNAADRLFYTAFLALCGAGWGFTQPMSKIAVSTGHPPVGLIFWQLVIGAALMAVVCVLRGVALPLRRNHLKLYVILALIGTIIPNTGSYQAIAHLPSGIVSILLSMIPMLAFPISLALGLDRFEWRRVAGLLIGLIAVLLIAVPGQDLNSALPVFWLGVVLFVCLCYASEGNYVARWGTQGLDALQVLFGASLVGALIALPLAVSTGQWINPIRPWAAPEWALVASSVAHVCVYAGYVWLVGKAGPVFAVQISYMVTLFGLFWAKLILAEAYAPMIWVALALMLVGMYLVQPRAVAMQDDPEAKA
ncbi:MAG: DMT family transporter [Paracoccaceae bacterium]